MATLDRRPLAHGLYIRGRTPETMWLNQNGFLTQSCSEVQEVKSRRFTFSSYRFFAFWSPPFEAKEPEHRFFTAKKKV